MIYYFRNFNIRYITLQTHRCVENYHTSSRYIWYRLVKVLYRCYLQIINSSIGSQIQAILYSILFISTFIGIFMVYRLLRKRENFSQLKKLIVILLILNVLYSICSFITVSFILLLFYDAIFNICIEAG